MIVKILSGLGDEYNNIASAVRARVSPISYEELSGMLQDQELVLKHAEQKKGVTPITGTVAQKPFHQNRFNNMRLNVSNNQQWCHPGSLPYTNSNLYNSTYDPSITLWRPHQQLAILLLSASVEFFPSTFIMKDMNTGVPLVRGQNNGGLYKWPAPSTKSPASLMFASSTPTLARRKKG